METGFTLLLPYILCILCAYHMGGVNAAWLFAKARGFDIRETGSHNAGTTNAGRTMGLGVALAVFLIDAVKCALVVYLTKALFQDLTCIVSLTVLACVVGHMFPFYLDLRGGKGIAVLLGSALVLDWRLFLALLAWVVVVAFISNYMSAATLSASLLYLVWFIVSGAGLWDCIILGVVVALIFFKHRANLRRLFTGQELGLRQTFFGKSLRVKK